MKRMVGGGGRHRETEMPNAIGKLRLCFARLRRSTSTAASTSSTTPLRPKRPIGTNSTPCSSSSSSVLFKNFNSLYDPASSHVSRLTTTTAADIADGSDSDSSITSTVFSSYQDDLSAALASRRFHLSSPGRSNSIVDGYPAPAEVDVPGVGVAVRTYSHDPYREFRHSMEEMTATMGLVDPREHGGCLLELLLCYLALNSKHAHEHIVRAFADLLRDLCHCDYSGQDGVAARPPNEHAGDCFLKFANIDACSPPVIIGN